MSQPRAPKLAPKAVEVNGTELHYVWQGEGEPVVFVHGGLGDYRTWGLQMAPFAAHYHAISYSRRGHYPNAFSSDYRSEMMVHVEDLAALIRLLAGGRARIVGNSYGSYLSLLLALHYPDLVRAMVLAEPPVHPILRRLPGGEAMFEEFMREAWLPARQAFAEGDLQRGVSLFLEGAVGPGGYTDLSPRAREGLMKNAPELQASALAPYDTFMLDVTCEQLATIRTPTLLLLGELSPAKYSLINAELARCLPHAEQARIPGASHILHAHNPAAHNRVVMRFLAAH